MPQALGKIYKVESKEQPSFINREMWIGLLGGIALPLGGPLLTPLILAGFTGTGAFLGRKRMERELAEGKPVEPPKLLNTGAAIGGLTGICVGAALGGLAYAGAASLAIAAVEAGTIATAGMAMSTVAAGVIGVGLLAAGITLFACIGAGLLIGGFIKKKMMTKEYAAAQAADPELHPELAVGKGRARSPEITAPAMNDLQAGADYSFRDKIAAERARNNGLAKTVT